MVSSWFGGVWTLMCLLGLENRECQGPGSANPRKALKVKLPDVWSRATPVFDDKNLVSCAGMGPADGVGRAGRGPEPPQHQTMINFVQDSIRDRLVGGRLSHTPGDRTRAVSVREERFSQDLSPFFSGPDVTSEMSTDEDLLHAVKLALLRSIESRDRHTSRSICATLRASL
jgi:hypothetical protein